MESTQKLQRPGQNGRSPKHKDKKKKKTWATVIKVILLAVILIGFIGAAATYGYIMFVLKDIEPLDPDRIAETLTENSVIVDSNGRILEQIQSDGLRTVVRYKDMSPHLIDAFVSVEDKTFFEHNGFNFIRLVGAVKDSLTSGKRIGGTSTITQQLARNIYLYKIRSTRNIDRKIKEAYYAIELEKYLTKEQIIEAYLNFVYLGRSSNGVEAASRAFFSKSASELDYIESAILAGIVKSPSVYSPLITKKQEAVTSEDYVFDDSDPLYTLVYNPGCESRFLTAVYLMHENGKISDAEYAYAKDVDLRTVIHPSTTSQQEISSFFSDMVKDEVIQSFMTQYDYTKEEAQNMLYTGGLTIESTIDFDMQKILESNYDRDKFTSYYGESAAAAVRAFQKDNGLSVDGAAGQQTIGKIAEITGMDKSIFTQQAYKKGSNNEEVILLKKTLFKLGYLVNNENFPKMSILLDKEGNIISDETKRILVYKQNTLINDEDQFIIPASDYLYDEQGNLVLFKNKRMAFYPHYKDGQMQRIQIVVKDTFTYGIHNASNDSLKAGRHNVSTIFTYAGRDVLVDDAYKRFDDQNNVVVDKKFLAENPGFFKKDAENNLRVEKGNYVISDQGVIQPQSAMTIIDYRTGELKAIVGGRNITGQRMFNRAINPRQPGSAIKPLSVFTPAIDLGKYTAATVIDDRPLYLKGGKQRWPVNWYEAYSNFYKYWGLVTLRESVQWSINTTAAQIVQDIGIPTSVEYLKKFGISTLVIGGSSNDENVAALALGGMTRGITPLDLTAAYGAIANGGTLNDVIAFKTVKNRKGEILLENKGRSNFVVDENVAYIVQDMMKTSVDDGVAKPAKLTPRNDIMQVSGKTGTTSSNIDAWFVGYTPYYVGGIWFGNDVNIPLDQGSHIAAQFWKTVMTEIHMDLEPKQFVRPSGIVTATVDIISGKLPSELSAKDPRGTVRSEIFLRGTVPTEIDDVHVEAQICKDSGKLATPFCPPSSIETRVLVKRPVPYDPKESLDGRGNPIAIKDMEYDLPIEECDIHTLENAGTGTAASYIGVQPLVTLADGTLIVQRPYPIELATGQVINLPAGSRITQEQNVLLPDGSVIPADNIKRIPNYTAAELDLMFPPEPEPEPETETETTTP